uniref:Uncharacterized protein n=1 Tax=Glossina palpalis gambiensis TaxID=67801 RepID=A0A1B0B722_9MUSC
MNTFNTSVMLYAHRTVHAVFQTLGMTEFLAFALDLTIAFRGNNYALNSHRIGPPIVQPCTAQPTNQPISNNIMFNHIQSGQQSFYNTNMCAVPKGHLGQKIIFFEYFHKKASLTLTDKIGSCNYFLKRPLDTKLTGAMPKELSYNAFSYIAAGFLSRQKLC